MKTARLTASPLLLAVLLSCTSLLLAQTGTSATAPTPATEAARLIEQGRQLQTQGKLDEAIASYTTAVKSGTGKDLL
jgi:hypothetical protein